LKITAKVYEKFIFISSEKPYLAIFYIWAGIAGLLSLQLFSSTGFAHTINSFTVIKGKGRRIDLRYLLAQHILTHRASSVEN
jgi:hypothetical protein